NAASSIIGVRVALMVNLNHANIELRMAIMGNRMANIYLFTAIAVTAR
ncbi:hypothetical protein EVA_14476, partial [gut metagenome]